FPYRFTWHSPALKPGGELTDEVRCVSCPAATGRSAVGDADADHLELAREDVLTVAGAVHPGLDHLARRGQRALAVADVLAHGPGAARLGPAGALDAGHEGGAGLGGVVEVVPGDH